MQRLALPLLLAAVLLVPSVNYQVFSGVPLSSVPEYLFGLALVPLVFHGAVRRQFARAVSRIDPRLAVALRVTAVVAVILKLTLLVSGDYRGLQGCYRSPLAAPPSAVCEASYENPLARFGVTRVDREIAFGPESWNLSFMNSLRFSNYHWTAGDRLRDRLPIEVTWTGWLDAPASRIVLVEYVGEGALVVGAASIVLPPVYDREHQVALEVPAGTHRVLLRYTFEDHSRLWQELPGPYATLALRFVDRMRAAAPVHLGPPSPARRVWTATAWVVDGLVLLLAASLAAFFLRTLARDAPWWLAIALAVWLVPPFVESSRVPVNGSAAVTGAGLTLLFVLLRRHRRALVGALFGLVGLGFFLLWPALGGVSRVRLRRAEDDWLTYESFARSILETGSLEGGEKVFYFQPLFRYVRFLEHLILGDGDLLIVVSSFAALTFAIVWMCRRLCRYTGRSAFARHAGPIWVCAAGGGLMLTLAVSGAGALNFLLAGASEYPTWIMLPAMLPRLFASVSNRARLSGTGLLGLSGLTRPNQLPALAAIFAASLMRPRLPRRTIAAAGAVLAGVWLLPLAHNLYYGGAAVAFTTSGGIAENYVLPPSSLLRAAADAQIRARLVRQLELLVGLVDPEGLWTLLGPAVHGLQGLWAGVVIWAIASRRLTPVTALLAATPLVYLGVHLVYQVNVYYPRHILAAHFMMGAVAILLVRIPNPESRLPTPLTAPPDRSAPSAGVR